MGKKVWEVKAWLQDKIKEIELGTVDEDTIIIVTCKEDKTSFKDMNYVCEELAKLFPGRKILVKTSKVEFEFKRDVKKEK